jgi:hypothetical protein
MRRIWYLTTSQICVLGGQTSIIICIGLQNKRQRKDEWGHNALSVIVSFIHSKYQQTDENVNDN